MFLPFLSGNFAQRLSPNAKPSFKVTLGSLGDSYPVELTCNNRVYDGNFKNRNHDVEKADRASWQNIN